MFENSPNRSPVFTTSGKQIVVQLMMPCADGVEQQGGEENDISRAEERIWR